MKIYSFWFSSPTVSAGAYGPSGFIRVNGNPLDGQVVNDPASCKPLPSSSPYPSLHGHGCSATTNRELQCILKELKFITNRMKLNDEVSISIPSFGDCSKKIDRLINTKKRLLFINWSNFLELSPWIWNWPLTGGRDHRRLEVRGHGHRQVLPHHFHSLHCHHHHRRLGTITNLHLKINIGRFSPLSHLWYCDYRIFLVVLRW